jgi:hypothetical protein
LVGPANIVLPAILNSTSSEFSILNFLVFPMLSNLQLQITCISSGVLAQALLIQLDSARRPETSGQDQDKDEEKDEEKTCHVLDIEANLTSPTLNLGQKWVLSKHLKFEELETFPPVEGTY